MLTRAVQEQRPRGTFAFPLEFHHVDKTHPRYHMPLHWHMDYELIRVLSGELSLSLDTRSLTLYPGDVALVQEGVVHGGVPRECVYQCIDMDLNAFLRGNVPDFADSDTVVLDATFPRESEEARTIGRLFDTVQAAGTGYAFLAQGLILQLVGLILQNHRYVSSGERTARSQRRVRQLKSALKFIRKRYARPVTLNELAEAAGMSPRYFCRFFSEMTGRTPIDYLNFYRVERACERLTYTDESVTEIALSCGFNDLSYFVKTFRKYKGTTPKQYRKGSAV